MTKPTKPKQEFIGFRPWPHVAKGVLKLHARDGMIISEQANRALEEFLLKKRVIKKGDMK